MKNINEVIAIIENTKTRSAWNRGVKTYALGMLEDIDDGIRQGWIDPEELCNRHTIDRILRNGASSWEEYSWGGCALIYDCHIAQRLCTATELKQTRNGQRRPNAHEDWLDVQARACYQAAQLIIRAFLEN